MASPFLHTLLSWDTYEADNAGDVEGTGQPTIGRTHWDFTLEVAEVTSVTVVIQGAAVDDDDEYATLATFNSGAITTTGTYTLNAPDDFTVEPYHEYLRAKVTAQTGDATVRVVAEGPFIDPDDAGDTALLSKELREYEDGMERIVEDAERVVRIHLLSDQSAKARAGMLAVVGPTAGLYDDIRGMVAKQADWLYRRHILARSRDADSARQLEEMDPLAPGLMERVRRMMPESAAYWRGR